MPPCQSCWAKGKSRLKKMLTKDSQQNQTDFIEKLSLTTFFDKAVSLAAFHLLPHAFGVQSTAITEKLRGDMTITVLSYNFVFILTHLQ